MGYYINPPDMSKEQFLSANGIPVNQLNLEDFWLCEMNQTPKDYLPVCWVDNWSFTAAGIAYNKGETLRFLSPDDRPKQWYLVKRTDLLPYYKEDQE